MANIPQEFNNFFLKDVSFVNLMKVLRGENIGTLVTK